MLICRDNSHAFQDRTLNLDEAVKIGRSVARTRASIDNAIFDCKVLSRNHAQLWYKNGKFYLQDTGSSNGTFVNNQRLSTTGSESKAKEVCSGDIVQFGVDVIESTKKVTHGCIIATLKLYLPDGKEAISNRSMYVTRQADVTLEDLYKLNQYVQEASRREKVLQSKLTHLQKLVDNMKVSASQSWKALIDEDRLLSRVKTVESQLVAYSKNFTEDKIRNELVKLEEEKSQYQIVAKDTLQKVHQEKIELSQKIMHLECRLNETEDECQSLHDISKNTQLELQELAVKYTTSQKNLLQLEVSCNEKEQNNIDLIKTHEQEKQDIIDKLKQHNKIEIYLKNKLKQYRIDRINIHKQLTILKNYLQPSFNNDGTIIDASTNIIPNSIMDTINITLDDILNESSNIDIDNIDDSLENLINLQSNDSNEKLTSTSIADTTTTTTTTNSSITTATEPDSPNASFSSVTATDGNDDKDDCIEKCEEWKIDDDEEEEDGEHLEGDYIKTLKPLSSCDRTSYSNITREHILQNFITALESIKGDDNIESQQIVNRELDDIREWFIREPNEQTIEKLKDIYYRTKNDNSRMEEVNEQLVILKEKFEIINCEKSELTKQLNCLKNQCGDMLNATYSIPIHYVAPIAIAFGWMLFDKLF
ncbi:hypothetical protein HCN44_004359 [Aphidius gifuensis]|uniref:FHA domain-containing protein n=1 Tax=Aphidius gifuensis TaxID=684658 RepID=A0A834XYW9_APHGI|nr:hypothetical protein HCN44_004359 [Aphidius gifuensis]